MSLVSILDPRMKVSLDPTGQVPALILDVADEEIHQLAVELTGEPREFGIDVRDGYFVRPRRVSIAGRWVHATTLRPISLPGYVALQWALVESLMVQPLPLTLSTTIRTYRNMRIVTAEGTRMPGKRRELGVRMALEQVRYLYADVPADVPAESADAVASEASLGPVGTVAQPA